jgi:hypothetical protein
MQDYLDFKLLLKSYTYFYNLGCAFLQCSRFTMLGVDTNYILDSLRGSELLELQVRYTHL